MYKVNRNVIMGKSQYDIEVLCRKYLDRAISEEELAEMLDYFKDHGIPEAFDQMLGQEFSKTMNNAPSEDRSEERRVGKECRCGRAAHHEKRKGKITEEDSRKKKIN